MPHNLSLTPTSLETLTTILGTEIPDPELAALRDRIEIVKVPPAQTFWDAGGKSSGIYFPTPNQKLGHWWKRVTHNYPFYSQQSSSDCGAACIVMVGRYWGKEFNINRLRELAYVSRDGASLKGLTNAVEQLGFNCRPVRASLAKLGQQKLTAIAHWQVTA